MSGIYGVIVRAAVPERDSCLLIGAHIPHIHHSDGVPVYVVVEHAEGFPVVLTNGTKAPDIKRLLAYPSHWPRHGYRSGDWVYAYVEPMPFNALIPLFDVMR